MRDHSSEKDFQACLKNNINLNALFLLCFRHVLLVMFITFSWVVRTQLACVSPLRTTFKRFEHIDHASNQVDCCSNFQICLICSFFFSPPPFSTFLNCPTSRLSFRPSNLNQKIKKIYRPAHQDMCGTREILKDENQLEHVTLLATISTNFLNIHRVGQVSV